MAFNQKLVTAYQATAITGFTGAAPQVVNGNTCLMEQVKVDSLSANVYVKATVNTLTLTASWQISDDNSTWRPALPSNGAANVVLVTGTGSAVTTTVSLAAPSGAYGHRYARLIVTSGVGVGGGLASDEASVSYAFCKPDFI